MGIKRSYMNKLHPPEFARLAARCMAGATSIPMTQTLTVVETTSEQPNVPRIQPINEVQVAHHGSQNVHLLPACCPTRDLLLRASNVIDHLLSTGALFARKVRARWATSRVFVACVRRLRMAALWWRPGTRVSTRHPSTTGDRGLEHSASAVAYHLIKS